MTQGAKKTDQNRFSEQTSYNRLNGKAWLTAVLRLSGNIPTPVSVDLIGEKNQVILEYLITWLFHSVHVMKLIDISPFNHYEVPLHNVFKTWTRCTSYLKFRCIIFVVFNPF